MSNHIAPNHHHIADQPLSTLSDKSCNSPRLKVAVLVSGSGSNLQVLIDGQKNQDLPIDLVGVISNSKEAYAIKRAQQADIPCHVLSHITTGEHAGKRMKLATFEKLASQQLNQWQPDLIVLAGFMRVLSAQFIEQAFAPMINLHPSILPKYKGLNTHQRALAANDSLHGCSIHQVTAELDAGQVLTQAITPIKADDDARSLQKRVQVLEHRLLPWTLLLIAKGVINASTFNTQNSNSVLFRLPYKLWFDE